MRRLLVAVVLLVAAACSDGDAGTPESPSRTDWSVLEPGWTKLPAPPHAAACPTSVWTGHELIYWGGDKSCQEGPVHDEGAAFDPAKGKWRRLPPAPIDGRSSAAAVWTGEELLIWGGWNGGPRDDGAAYVPSADEWRLLAESPLDPELPTAAVWTGREMLVWIGPDGATYDPSEDAWRELPSAPYALDRAHGVWTGQEMIVYGMSLNTTIPHAARGLAFDPQRNRWRELAPLPLSPSSSMVVWTGREMIAWDYEFHAGAYDPTSDSWRTLPDLPLDFYECYTDGALAGEGFVLSWHCGQAAVLDLASDTWRELPRPPSSVVGAAVAADGIVLFAGAWAGVNTLWAYRPGPPGATGFVPDTERRGDRDFLPLTFPDGTRIVLSYPHELFLAGMTVEPGVSYLYRDDRPPRFELEFVFGPAEPGPDQIALEDGAWTVLAQLRDPIEAKTVAKTLAVRESGDGLPIVEARGPIALSNESGEGGGLSLTLGLPGQQWIELQVEPHCVVRPLDVDGGAGGWCLGDYSVVAYGKPHFIDAVYGGLRLEDT